MGRRTDDLRVIRETPLPFKCCSSCKHFVPEYEDGSATGWCDHPKRGDTADHSGFRNTYEDGGKLIVLVERTSSCNGYEASKQRADSD